MNATSKNTLEILQIVKPEKDPFKYACGVFVVASYDPHDLINFVRTYQYVIPFERGLDFVRKWFAEADGELQLVSRDLTWELKCSIT